MPAPEMIAPISILPEEIAVTFRRPVASRVAVKVIDSGAIEPVAVAATGKLAFSAVWISVAALEKLVASERLTDPEKVYPCEVMDKDPFIACDSVSVRSLISAPYRCALEPFTGNRVKSRFA